METQVDKVAAPVVKYNVSNAAIAQMEAEYLPLTIKGVEDKGGIAAVHEARIIVKNKRVEVEHTRKELKADALTWGKKVDAEARRITAKLQPIEDHLRQEEDKVKAEKARIRAEAERKEEERLQFRVNLLQQLGRQVSIVNIKAMSDEEFQIAYDQAKAEHEAEQARLAKEEEDRKALEESERVEREAKEEEDRKEREAEDARLKKQRDEQARVAKEQDDEKARLKKEADKVEADRLALAEEKRLEDAKKEAAERGRQEEKDRVARELAEAEERDRKAKVEEARQEALKPDKEKLWTYVLALSYLPAPELKTKEAKAILAKAKDVLLDLAEVVKGSIEKM